MNLAAYLREKSLSTDAFAKQIGTSQAAVHRYAVGNRMPRPDILAKIRAATGGSVTANDFVEFSEQARAS